MVRAKEDTKHFNKTHWTVNLIAKWKACINESIQTEQPECNVCVIKLGYIQNWGKVQRINVVVVVVVFVSICCFCFLSFFWWYIWLTADSNTTCGLCFFSSFDSFKQHRPVKISQDLKANKQIEYIYGTKQKGNILSYKWGWPIQRALKLFDDVHRGGCRWKLLSRFFFRIQPNLVHRHWHREAHAIRSIYSRCSCECVCINTQTRGTAV